ncbi:MAG: RNA polymerase factor sigma-54 [Muribaculaceae bacterium]|nr:RNA polymerase factor sigma-54 [Muribaculaceae bacterium]
MASSERLQQVQQQRLQQRLNPQNVALGRLLEMSVPELEDEIRRELDDNPALEASESVPDDSHDEFGESADQLQMADYADADDAPAGIRARSRLDDAFDPVTIAPDDGDSLIDAVMKHLTDEYELNEQELRIAEHIVGNLDDNGYLTRCLADIADDIAMAEGFEPRQEQVKHVFGLIRSLEPAGICAVDLRDCLLLQLDRLKPSQARSHAGEIIADHFDSFAKKHFDRLQAQLGISRSELAEALELIRTLNPKPASGLDLGRGADSVRHITPDIALDYDPGSDTFTLSLLGNIPEMSIEQTFAREAEREPQAAAGDKAGLRQRKALTFIRRKRDDAAAFIKLVEMRSATLMSIARAIVDIQRSFFISGDKADIRPMILRDIAARTGLDLSVISRAAAGKYILTPHGVYPLKLFFNERPDADADVSAHEILKVIEELIDSEDKHNPLPDRELCEALRSRGYDLARRTVAKYRERLGHPVARLRKQL